MKNTIIRLTALLLMALFYLPIFSANTRTYSIMGFSLYVWLWFFLMLIFGTTRFFAKSHMYLYLYAFVYFVFMQIFWNQSGEGRYAFLYLYQMFLAISLYEYFLYSGDVKGMNIIIKAALIFISITCLMGIWIYLAMGLSSRMIYQEVVQQGERYGASLSRWGSAGITFYYGLALIIPAVIACIKSISRWNGKRIALILFVVIALVALFIAEYATAMLLAIIGMVFAMLGVRRFRTSLLITLIVISLSIFLPKSLMVYGFDFAADLSPGEIMSARMDDLSITMERGVSAAETHTARRADRIPFLLGNILQSPIIGRGPSTGHSFWLDRFSMFGLLGMLPLFLIYRYQYKRNNIIFNDNYKFYYFITLLIFIAMGIMKNMAGEQFPLAFLLMVPGIYHTDLFNQAV